MCVTVEGPKVVGLLRMNFLLGEKVSEKGNRRGVLESRNNFLRDTRSRFPRKIRGISC